MPPKAGAADIGTAVTRELCAAVYYDMAYQQQVLDLVAGASYRSIAYAPGVSVRSVIQHAVVARHYWRMRDATLAGSCGAVAVVLLLAGAGPLLLRNVGVLLLIAAVRALMSGPRRGTRRWLSLPTVFTAGAALIALYEVTGRSSRSRFDRPASVTTLMTGVLRVSVLLLAITAANVVHLYRIDKKVLGFLRRNEVPPPPSSQRTNARFERLVADAPEEPGADDVVCFGGYEPFVGAGPVRAHWGIATSVTTALDAADGDVKPFGTAALITDLYQCMRKAELPGAKVRVAHFVDGRDVEFVGLLGRGAGPNSLTRPLRVAPDAVRSQLERRNERLRSYLVVELSSWGGQVVASAFLRPEVRREILYLEAHYTVLQPIDRRYQIPDPVETDSASGLLTVLGRGATMMLGLMPMWYRLTSERRWRRNDQRARLAVDHGTHLNRGAIRSVRDLATGPFTRYFQEVDASEFVKVVDRYVFSAVADFLRDHNISSKEFSEQAGRVEQTVISGGTFSGPVQFGRGSSVLVGTRQ